jgi:hypothetical protein
MRANRQIKHLKMNGDHMWPLPNEPFKGGRNLAHGAPPPAQLTAQPATP